MPYRGLNAIKISDLIKLLKDLKEEDYNYIGIDVNPIVECFEDYRGNGLEKTKYEYTITLISKEISRKYKNRFGIKEYIQDKNREDKK